MLFYQRAKRLIRQWELENRCVAGSKTILTGSITNRQGRREAIRIGTRSRIAAELLVYDDAGLIEIGDDCVINGGARIWSADAVRIGDRVLISHDVFIHDCNAHPLSARRRFQHVLEILEGRLYRYDDVAHAPVVIEDDVWINAGATVLKGVTIGREAVVGAGAVVTRDIECYTVVAGVPARKIGDAWE